MDVLRVHVVGFAPVAGRTGVGGFDWFHDEAEARRMHADNTRLGHFVSRLNLGVKVPDDVEAADITEWLDANPDLWEPTA